ncbi:MAG: hypothetical protein LQ340_002056 [Diploschistes diacapsis]|nr:MAG: hypothetical protein LQ340_002056 [Diploschistes diacapsis]
MRLVTSNDIFNLAVAHEYDANIDLDLTWNYVDAEVWTFVEPAAGIVSCCIPASGFLLDWALKRSGLSRARKSSQGQRWTSGQASNSGSSGKTPNIRSFTRLREPSIRSNGAYLGSKAAVITDAGPTSMPRCLDGEELQQLHVIDTIDVTWEAV